MLEVAGKKISLKPQPEVKKSLATVIGSRNEEEDLKKSCVASSSNDTDDGMLEGSSVSGDSENVIHQPAVSKGDYVLVKFAKKQHMSYYAGRVVHIDIHED